MSRDSSITFALLLSGAFFLGNAQTGHAALVTGYPTRIGVASPDEIVIRTPDTDIVVRRSLLSPSQLAEVDQGAANNTSVHMHLPDRAIARRTRVPGGVRPDCSELPVSYEQLTSRVQSGGPEGFLSFLNSIPAGTLQTFTLAYGSASSQREGITAKTPRVIRSTNNGSIIMAYNCNPEAPTYGTVEMIRREGGQLRFSRADFRQNPPAIIEDPPECRACHQAMTVHPTTRAFHLSPPTPGALMVYRWDNYPLWQNFFGMADGRLSDQPTAIVAEAGSPPALYAPADRASFLNFRENQARTNPCYQSLPWATSPMPETMDHYPFFHPRARGPGARQDRIASNFSNFRIGTAIGQGMAESFVAQIERNPHAQKIEKILFSLLGCSQWSYPHLNWQRLRTLVPGLPADPPYSAMSLSSIPYGQEPMLAILTSPSMTQALAQLGIPPGAWELNAGDAPGHRPLYGDGVMALYRRFFTQLGERVRQQEPSLDPLPPGHIDDLTGTPTPDDVYERSRYHCTLPGEGVVPASRPHYTSSGCRQLDLAIAEDFAEPLSPTPASANSNPLPCPQPDSFESVRALEREVAVPANRLSGQENFQQCVACHGGTLQSRLSSDRSYLETAIQAVSSGRMPQNHPLDPSDRSILIQYMRSIAAPSQQINPSSQARSR